MGKRPSDALNGGESEQEMRHDDHACRLCTNPRPCRWARATTFGEDVTWFARHHPFLAISTSFIFGFLIAGIFL